MPGEPKKIPRPSLVGHLEAQIKTNLAGMVIFTGAGVIWYWWGYVAATQRRYALANMKDIGEEYNKIVATGALDSAKGK